MEKREPSLVPEWLRSTGNGSRVGSKNHTQSSSARLDNSKSRNHRTKTDVDSVGSPFLDRSSSIDVPRRFSNGSTKNAYRNFNVKRRGRGKDRRMEKDRLTYIDPSDHVTSFTFGTLNERNQEQLRRSNSMKTRKQDDHLGQGFTMGFKNGRSIYNKNRMLPGTSQATSSKDFPLLKTEERNEGGPDVVKISSRGLSLAVQSLSVGDSGATAEDGWAPAPVEVPNVIEKSGSDSVGTWITLTGQNRNMAETLLQGPRTGTLPQESLEIQRLENRALKLIPVVPSAPKGSVSKAKPMVRTGATGFASFRNTHQHSSMRLVKESGSSTRTTNSLSAGFQMIAAPSAPFITSVAKTQSRNAFYSALKKKTSTNISTSSCIFSSVEEKTDITKELVASDTSNVQAVEKVEKVSEAAERDTGFESADLPDEKEAEFLKSLGWDENNTEIEPLTDEEIRAFYEQHKKLKPSLKKHHRGNEGRNSQLVI